MYSCVIVVGSGKHPFYSNVLYTSENNIKFVEVVIAIASVSPTLCCLCLWTYSILSVSSKRLWHKVIPNSRHVKVTRKSYTVLQNMLNLLIMFCLNKQNNQD